MNGYDDPYDTPESAEWRSRQRRRFVWIVVSLITLAAGVIVFGLFAG